MEEIGRGGGPDPGDDALDNHGAINDRLGITLVFHATGHQWALGRVETGDRPAGDADKHDREDRQAARMRILQTIRYFRQGRPMNEKHH